MKSAILTVSDVLDRCDEVGECWEWKLFSSPNGTPRCKFMGAPDSAYRAAYLLHHGLSREDIEGLCIWPGCNNHKCVNPAHLLAGTRADMMAWRKAAGRCKRSPEARALDQLARRARGVRFAPQEIEEIRAAKTSEREEGEIRHVNPSLIGRIRRHEIYRSTVQGASVFALRSQ